MNPNDLSQDSDNLSEEISDQESITPQEPEGDIQDAVPDTSKQFLPWPPPGLEQIQGALLPSAGFLGLGAAILVLPLLLSVATEQRFWSLGPLGNNWWIVLLTTVLGLLIVSESLNRMFQLLRSGNLAVKQGHGWLTVIQVAADSTRDTGFLLQGTRIFSNLDLGKRTSLALTRILGIGLYLAGSIWLLFGFLLSVFFASRGWFGTAAISFFTLIPTTLCLVCAYLCRLKSGFALHTLKKQSKSEVEEEVGDQIKTWTAIASQFESKGVTGRGPSSRILRVRISLIILILVGIYLFVPVMWYISTSSAINIMAQVVTPNFQGVQDKATLVEMYRPYRLESDPSITALRAGEALQNLNYIAGRKIPEEIFRPPVIEYDQEWLFNRGRSGLHASDYFGMSRRDILRSDWADLEKEASNPAHREFGIMARAVSADFGGARYIRPLPDNMSWVGMPIPRFRPVTEGARAHIGKAAYDFHTGRIDQAEITILEVISAGFLMLDEEPTLIGNLIGIVMIGIGGEALQNFYNASGREDEALMLRRIEEEVETAVIRRRSSKGLRFDVESSIRSAASDVQNEELMRGLRWEMIPSVTLLTPCLNIHKAVFGLGEDYDTWLQEAHNSLVRWPFEEELFELTVNYYITPKASQQHRSLFERLLVGFFLRPGTQGDCALMFGYAVDEIM